MKQRTLPLGVDIGTTKLRVALSVQDAHGARVRAVAVRDLSPGTATSGPVEDPQYVATLLEEALRELKTRERRCIGAIGAPYASVLRICLPRMSRAEREAAACFEAERYADVPIEQTIVRVHRTSISNTYAMGIVRRSSLSSRVETLRRAGLRVVAIDHEAFAYARVLDGFDAVVDVGLRRTTLHVITGEIPFSIHAPCGGAHLTSGIAQDLAIDEHSAEKRKRIVGISGAGQAALGELVTAIAALIRTARQSTPIVRIGLMGNASRLGRTAAALEQVTGVSCEIPVAPIFDDAQYPHDVIRSSAQDWTLAAALTTWERT